MFFGVPSDFSLRFTKIHESARATRYPAYFISAQNRPNLRHLVDLIRYLDKSQNLQLEVTLPAIVIRANELTGPAEPFGEPGEFIFT
jgi:hypothetical protein